MKREEFESELLFEWIDDLELRTKLSNSVKCIKNTRKERQKDISDSTGIPLTKVKQIENGSCKDFNAINNYINYSYKPFYKV